MTLANSDALAWMGSPNCGIIANSTITAGAKRYLFNSFYPI
jgi:hypothetical protein